LRLDQFQQRDAERVGDMAQHHDRGVGFAAFDLGQVALGDRRAQGQRLARHAAPGACLAHAMAQRRDEFGIGGLVVEGRVGGGGVLGLGVHWLVPRWQCNDGTGTIVHVFDKSQLFLNLVNAYLVAKAL
jgi:hypothetical protein